ncbi:MAG: endonuclease/exonuclease/phosphatase family protein [Myxococcota bacterium]
MIGQGVALRGIGMAWLLVFVGASGCRLSAGSSVDPVAPRSPSASTRRERSAPTLVRVASWNVRRLGQAKTDLARVAEVLAHYDIVAIQEVMTREVVDALRERLPEHAILLTDTPRPKQGSHREYYAFVYRRARMDPVMNTFYPDPADDFVRDPFVACFDGGDAVGRLCLLTVHVVWGDRVAQRKDEILAIDDALRWARNGGIDAEWIVLGDFNRPFDDGDRDEDPEEEWLELIAPHVEPSPMLFVGPETPTTLGKNGYANAYDHCFVSAPLQSHVRKAERLDIVAEVCGGSVEVCLASVSDHAPYGLELAF